MSDLFIQKAVKKKGSLRATVKRKYGAEGFKKDGTIKVSVLKDLRHAEGVTGKRARLALTLRKLRK